MITNRLLSITTDHTLIIIEKRKKKKTDTACKRKRIYIFKLMCKQASK